MVSRLAPAAAGRIACRAGLIALIAGFLQESEAAAQAAAEPIVVAVSGRINMFTFVRDDTDAPEAVAEDMNPAGIFTYSRLTVEARAVLAEGWTARGLARFIANPRQPENMDEVFVEVAGPYGRVQLGDRQAVNAVMIDSAVPQAFLNVSDEIVASAVRPRTEITMRDGLTYKRYSRGATAVVYQSPRWNTLQLGVGYYPTGNTPISTAQRVQTRNATEMTISHLGQVSETIRYRVLAGHFNADVPLGPHRIRAWNAATSIFIGPVEVGGTRISVSPIHGLREKQWTVGAMYDTGVWKVSTDFRRAKRIHEADGSTHEKVERLMIQGAYRLGPGINLGTTLFHSFQRDRLQHVWRSRGAIVGITVGF